LGEIGAKNTEVFMERVTWRRRKTNWQSVVEETVQEKCGDLPPLLKLC